MIYIVLFTRTVYDDEPDWSGFPGSIAFAETIQFMGTNRWAREAAEKFYTWMGSALMDDKDYVQINGISPWHRIQDDPEVYHRAIDIFDDAEHSMYTMSIIKRRERVGDWEERR